MGGFQFNAWAQRRRTGFARYAILEQSPDAFVDKSLITTLGHLYPLHIVGAVVDSYRAGCNGVAIGINAQRFNRQLERVGVTVCTVFAFGNLPFAAVTITGNLDCGVGWLDTSQ
jgi:hypothetical protein